MKRAFILCVGLVMASAVTKAQEEPKRPSNNIGFSARFFNNPVTPFVLMYKRQVTPALALRLGLALNTNSQRVDAVDGRSYTKFSNSTFSPSLGAEWQKNLAKNFTFYGGADIRGIFTSTKTEDFADNDLVNQTLLNTKAINFSPFIGLRYNIIEQLYVATEANLGLTYTKTINTNNNIPLGTSGSSSAYQYQAVLQPAVGLFLFYCF